MTRLFSILLLVVTATSAAAHGTFNQDVRDAVDTLEVWGSDPNTKRLELNRKMRRDEGIYLVDKARKMAITEANQHTDTKTQDLQQQIDAMRNTASVAPSPGTTGATTPAPAGSIVQVPSGSTVLVQPGATVQLPSSTTLQQSAPTAPGTAVIPTQPGAAATGPTPDQSQAPSAGAVKLPDWLIPTLAAICVLALAGLIVGGWSQRSSDGLANRVTNLENTVNHPTDGLAAVRNAIRDAATGLPAIAALHGIHTALATEIRHPTTGLATRLAGVSGTLATVQGDVGTLQAGLQTVRDQLDEPTLGLAAINRRLNDHHVALTDPASSINSRFIGLRDDLTTLETAHGQLRTEHDKIVTDVDEPTLGLAAINLRLEAAEGEIRRLAAAIP